MKKLKLLTAVVILAMSSTLASAQIAFAIKGGANLSNFYSDELSDKNTKVGFHVGLQADYEFTPNMAIQPGLFFTTKGSKITTEYQEKEGEFSQNLMYLQLPVHFAYKQDITPGTRIVFHAGPYVAYGVGGKSKVTAGSITLESDKAVSYTHLDVYKRQIVFFVTILPLHGLSTTFGQLHKNPTLPFDFLVSKFNGFKHFCFRNLAHFAFYHQDIVNGSSHYNIDIGIF